MVLRKRSLRPPPTPNLPPHHPSVRQHELRRPLPAVALRHLLAAVPLRGCGGAHRHGPRGHGATDSPTPLPLRTQTQPLGRSRHTANQPQGLSRPLRPLRPAHLNDIVERAINFGARRSATHKCEQQERPQRKQIAARFPFQSDSHCGQQNYD